MSSMVKIQTHQSFLWDMAWYQIMFTMYLLGPHRTHTIIYVLAPHHTHTIMYLLGPHHTHTILYLWAPHRTHTGMQYDPVMVACNYIYYWNNNNAFISFLETKKNKYYRNNQTKTFEGECNVLNVICSDGYALFGPNALPKVLWVRMHSSITLQLAQSLKRVYVYRNI